MYVTFTLRDRVCMFLENKYKCERKCQNGGSKEKIIYKKYLFYNKKVIQGMHNQYKSWMYLHGITDQYKEKIYEIKPFISDEYISAPL